MSDRGARLIPLIALMLVALLTVACSPDSDTAGTPPKESVPPTRATDPPGGGKEGACYRIDFKRAVAPTTVAASRRCSRSHTTETYRVGELRTVVDGHLLAVDADRVQAQVSTTCPRALSKFVGGTPDDLRLSMIRPVWFTPSVDQSDEGERWFRCDAVVLSGASTLATRTGSLRGLLNRPGGRASVAMCGTAAPDDPSFERVLCTAKHSWRAISIVTFEGRRYPGARAAQDRGATPCEDAAADRAEDPLSFRWGYEWPTRARWAAGQQFGRCWVPD